MDAEVAQAIARLESEVSRLNDELNMYKQSGLDALRTRNLSFHNEPYVTDVPTEEDEDGSPRLVRTGTGPNTYALYRRTPDGWKSVALS